MMMQSRRLFSSKPSKESVKALRDATRAGIMDCYKALQESEGDLEKAVKLLQERLGEKLMGRQNALALEGRVELNVATDRSEGTMVEVLSETDFVAKTDTFQTLCQGILKRTSDTTELEALREASAGDVKETARVLGEKLEIRRAGGIQAALVGGYLHSVGGVPKIGALVGFESSATDTERAAHVADRLAVHVAGVNPKDVNSLLKEDFESLGAGSGSVADVLKREKLSLKHMLRFERGEGLEDTRQEDFVKEVEESLKKKD